MKNTGVLDNLFSDDVELVKTTVYRFSYDQHGFYIEVDFSTGEWYAVHTDEEKWEDAEILTNAEGSVELFDVYTLTPEEFGDLKKRVKELIDTETTNTVENN